MITHNESTERALGNHPEAVDPALIPLSRAEAAHLVRLSLEAAAERSLPATYDGVGGLILHQVPSPAPETGGPGPFAGSGMVAGLSNLARIVGQQRPDCWPQLVGEHFDHLVTTLLHGPPLTKDPEQELYQRLTPSSTLDPGWTSQAAEFVPGLLSVPATNTDGTITMYFDPSDLGMTWAAAEQAGLRNLQALTDTVRYAEHEGTRVALLSGTPFTASRALVLDTVLRESLHVENPRHGVLAAMPVRDLLLIHVITDLRVIPALGMMLNITARSHVTEPGPLSPSVYVVTSTGWHPATRPPGEAPGLSPQLLAVAQQLQDIE
jgi:hypothetical protein